MKTQIRIAVVTGASSGMGKEFVRQLGHFYKNLDEIWVIARRQERLEALREQSCVPVRIFEGDLLKKQIYKEYYVSLRELSPDVRMLVNSAGFGKSGSFIDIAGEEKKIQTDMIDLNCRALTRVTQMTLPCMRKGSRIINLASAAAFCPQNGFAVYAATKAYVLNFSRALGSELRSSGVFVTAVCPGPVDTEFFSVCGELTDPLKKLAFAEAKDVVRKALLDSRRKRGISVYGTGMKAARLGAKLVPHSLILRAEELFTK